uniref:(California timema) hypothetical protein n=1 Tax=Timema californicum TaxID=61474 RepID=A0A7R9IVN7_TIMCA|nr:unnamed protein product [Timema californicum]
MAKASLARDVAAVARWETLSCLWERVDRVKCYWLALMRKLRDEVTVFHHRRSAINLVLGDFYQLKSPWSYDSPPFEVKPWASQSVWEACKSTNRIHQFWSYQLSDEPCECDEDGGDGDVEENIAALPPHRLKHKKLLAQYESKSEPTTHHVNNITDSLAWKELEESRHREPMLDAPTVSHRSREVAVQAPEESMQEPENVPHASKVTQVNEQSEEQLNRRSCTASPQPSIHVPVMAQPSNPCGKTEYPPSDMPVPYSQSEPIIPASGPPAIPHSRPEPLYPSVSVCPSSFRASSHVLSRPSTPCPRSGVAHPAHLHTHHPESNHIPKSILRPTTPISSAHRSKHHTDSCLTHLSRTSRSSYREEKRSHWAPFGWNDSKRDVGKKKTYNVSAPVNEVYQHALKACNKRRNEIKKLLEEEEKRKQALSMDSARSAVNHSSIWMSEYQDKFNKGCPRMVESKRSLSAPPVKKPIVWRCYS